MKAAIVDTNVLVAANGRAAQASLECRLASIRRLDRIRQEERLVLDAAWLILREYQGQVSSTGQPGPGDAFLKWVLSNRGNTDRCELVPLTPRPGAAEDFLEFPDDLDLAGFDPSDRKFAAVALGSAHRPPVVNATDSDWWDYRESLQRHGVTIEFLCQELMREQRGRNAP